MKALVKNTRKGILLVAMLAATLSFASEGNFSFSSLSRAKKTALTLENVKEGDILYIKDLNGVKLYEEIILINGFYSKGYDLTALPNGDYHFELDTDVHVKVIPFTVESNAIKVKFEKVKTIYKPTIRVKGDLVFISKLALNDEPLKVDVYYEKSNNSDLVLTETIKGTKNIERVYKLTDDLKNGDYKIVFNTNGREFTKLIRN